ncbi:MAG TPA: sigma-70 family RNA polymerase sigma factor [Polyangiaceae bacterium]|nr:sigma-70 family RNA polymerase sigma factor [Polyangiaceae bacterium]
MGPDRMAAGNEAAPHSEADALTALARLAAAGDPAATRQFLNAVWPVIGRVVAGVLGARHPEVEDVVQQTLIAVCQALPAFRGECHPAGYASRIALHVALRARRNAAVRRNRSEALAQYSLSEPEGALSDDLGAERRKRALRDLLTALPEEQAEALGLRVLLGWSLEEVARAGGVPINTVRSRVRLAKEALRRKLDRDPSLAGDLEFRP